MNDVVPVILAALATGLPLFLIASGLTLIFSVMRVLNFAHGALFMIGAFLVVSLLSGHWVADAACSRVPCWSWGWPWR